MTVADWTPHNPHQTAACRIKCHFFTRIPVSGSPDFTVSGPLRAAAFSYFMREYPDPDFVCTLAAVCRHGAAFGYRGLFVLRPTSTPPLQRTLQTVSDSENFSSLLISRSIFKAESSSPPLGVFLNLEVVVALSTTFPILITAPLTMEFCRPMLL
ncbi:hypothetical protein B0H19DRAFT_1272835 [Mycena capillaripes]|nr:hypothetical protein B0H19DRAFT_1272835 [Mycena capillaripes]